MLSKTLRLNFCYLKIIHILHQCYHSKKQKIRKSTSGVCILEIIRLIIKKTNMKMKNRSRRYGKNRPKPRYSKCKKCLNMMWLICIKQHLSNIWSWIHEKVKQHWAWVEKKLCLQGSYKAKALAWPETKNLVYFLLRKVPIRSICVKATGCRF